MRTSYVSEAARLDLAECPACGAQRGDPCRSPNDKTRPPHRERTAAARPVRSEEPTDG
jgi:hypothetical protein